LKSFCADEKLVLQVPEAVKDDLKIWAAIASDSTLGFPISAKPHDPPIGTINFISDAAGKIPLNSHQKNGVASLGYYENTVWFGVHFYWPKMFTIAVQSNTAVYEMVGLLLPFFAIPKKLQFRHIRLLVDNQAIVWSWEKRYMKNDVLASILIRCLHVIEAYLPCKIYIEHVPRMTNPLATLVDSLTRDITTTEDMKRYISHSNPTLPPCFVSWLNKPIADWSLPMQLITEIKL